MTVATLTLQEYRAKQQREWLIRNERRLRQEYLNRKFRDFAETTGHDRGAGRCFDASGYFGS